MIESSLTGKLAGRRGEAATVQGSSHQHNAHLLCGALEHLHVTILHGLFMALLGHHKRLVRRLHLDESISRGSTLQGGQRKKEIKNYQNQNTAGNLLQLGISPSDSV